MFLPWLKTTGTGRAGEERGLERDGARCVGRNAEDLFVQVGGDLRQVRIGVVEAFGVGERPAGAGTRPRIGVRQRTGLSGRQRTPPSIPPIPC